MGLPYYSSHNGFLAEISREVVSIYLEVADGSFLEAMLGAHGPMDCNNILAEEK